MLADMPDPFIAQQAFPAPFGLAFSCPSVCATVWSVTFAVKAARVCYNTVRAYERNDPEFAAQLREAEQARNAGRNARKARELPVKNGHALSLKRPIQKPARPLEFATYCLAGLMCGRKFRSTESSGLDYGSFARGTVLRHNGVNFGVGQSCLGVSERPTFV